MLSLPTLLAALLQLPLVLSAPRPLGVTLDKQGSLPVLKLPYATYKAWDYSVASDIYTFKNIRYAASPVGDFRWEKPAPPLPTSGIQDGDYGPNCVQAKLDGFNAVGPLNQLPIGGAANSFLGGIPIPLFEGGLEDCLFLDVYVPGKAIANPGLKLPVAVFIHGGGFVFGSKDALQPELPFYDGSGLINRSQNNMIFVAMNYRLGAYGFLAGTTMEKDGLPNTGLWDQRAAFQWVKDYISLLGGDPSRVTAMGESGGASSLMHHLVAQGGQLDPLFSRAILQSPAFELIWDRAEMAEQVFQNFSALAGCQGQGMSCLRTANPAVLDLANAQLVKQQTPGSFAVGPTPDGTFIRQLPSLELATGNFWKVESLVLSHVADEASVFVSGAIQTDDQLSAFLDAIFPSYMRPSGLTNAIESFYPPLAGGKNKSKGPYATETDRFEALLKHSCFTCNIRFLTEAYGDSHVWNMQYSVFPGYHGVDLFSTFYNPAISSNSFLEGLITLIPVVGTIFVSLSRSLQSYFVSYIATGDPNTNRERGTIVPTMAWGHPVSSGEQITGVVKVGDFAFETITDDQNPKESCAFWRSVAAAATALGGYVPPGALVQQNLVNITGDPSRNFIGGNPSR
ncbi:alpha/beta-hydrolase [Thozetella sp. PMI_491]|nr:alpha/beta-hydrolase [Thozetella sp. PMI_491]